MASVKIGRNDPCPCGSGKKYKKCCLGRERVNGTGAPPGAPPTAAINAELKQAVAGMEFQSLEEAQQFMDGFMRQRNSAPIDDFHGLSAEQMQRLLHFPFDSRELVSFPEVLPGEPAAPAATLLQGLLEAVSTDSLKPTSNGNLPRQVCRDILQSYREKWPRPARYLPESVNSELEFEELHAVRVVAQQAGLLRKYKGRFSLSRDSRELLTRDGIRAIFPRLFRHYAGGFNWGYRDRYPDLEIVQQSFAFSLYLLCLHGGTPEPQGFYEDAFLRAFPQALDGAEDRTYRSAEDWLRSCFTVRTLERFAWFFGLVALERVETEARFERKFEARKLPLFDEMVSFEVPL